MSWHLAASLAVLRSQVDATWPDRPRHLDGTIGDPAHAARDSDHNPDPVTGVVRALDLTVTTTMRDRLLAAVIGDPRLAYAIHDRRIWTPTGGWRAYGGSSPHLGHVHVSIRRTTAAETTTTLWAGLEGTRMRNPMVGRLTSGFGPRTIGGVPSWHGGIDIAPTIPGTTGTPVRAAFAGRVTRHVTGRKPGQAASTGTVLAPGRSGNGALITNPDGEAQLYGHVLPVVGLGAQVAAGQVIGHTDRSGTITGPHLHLETWTRAGTPADPMTWFAHHGITPGQVDLVTNPISPGAGGSLPTGPGGGITAPALTPTMEDTMLLITAPGRGTALVGPGYVQVLDTEEARRVWRGMPGVREHTGNAREFDVIRHGAVAGRPTGLTAGEVAAVVRDVVAGLPGGVDAADVAEAVVQGIGARLAS